jgi:uncharacterized protein (TIGR02284 family)
MISMNDEIVATLNRLVRLNQASELGFETAAEHIKNRGLKLLLKSYARQRARFGEELSGEIAKWGGAVQVIRNPLAALHRGWIDIKAALTVGRDNEAQVVLGECLRGERIALRQYEQARQAVLPVQVDEFLQQQAAEIEAVHDRLCRMAECSDEALLVQLFDHVEAAQRAVVQLEAAGIDREQIRLTPVAETGAYHCECQRQRILESTSAGAFSGAVAGLLMGIIVSLGLGFAGTELPWAFVVAMLFLSIGVGSLGGGLFGLIIGHGVTEDDLYLYDDSTRNGSVIVTVQLDRMQTPQARQLLRQQRDQERKPTLALVPGRM